jgi:hypothetical protein
MSRPTTTSRTAAAIGRMLIACARQHLRVEDSSSFEMAANDPSLDWDLLIQTASDHGVIPLLHRTLSRLGAPCPGQVKAAIAQRAQANGRRNLMLLHELLGLISAMQARGIRVMPYKGPLLALSAYGDPSLRQCGDLDILVPQADIPAAREILESRGYALSLEMDAHAEQEYVASPHEYDFPYIRKDPPVMVELHWNIVGRFFSFAPDPIELWQRGTDRNIGAANVRMLDPHDMLLILAAHGTKHFWSRLTWICDIAQFIKTNGSAIDWDRLIERAEAFDARGMLILAVLLAHEVLGIELPAAIQRIAGASERRQARELHERLFADSDHRDSVPKGARMQLTDGGLLQSLLFQARIRSWTHALRYLFHRALTPNHVDRSWLRLPRRLAPLYYLVRPLRLFSTYSIQPVIRIVTRPFPRIVEQAQHLSDRSTTEVRRLFYAMLLILAVRAALYVIPFRILRALADVPQRARRRRDDSALAGIAHDVVAAAQFVPGATCLTQALTAQILLRREGFEPALEIGVARDPSGQFKAHAWVRCEGIIVVGDFTNGPTYVPMVPRADAA